MRGFRVKEIETIDIDGLTISLEDSMELHARSQSMDVVEETSKPRKHSVEGGEMSSRRIDSRHAVESAPRAAG